MQLAYADEVYQLENEARLSLSGNDDSLMTSASKQVAFFIEKHLSARPSLQNLPLVFFAGRGNNGGDAIASAMFFSKKFPNKKIIIYSLTNPTEFNDEIGHFYRQLPKQVDFFSINNADDIKNFPQNAVIIDGLLGIGFKGSCKENLRTIINFINEKEFFTIAIDIPSGLNANDGSGETIIRADITLTIGVPKIGLYVNHGVEYSGIIEFLDINLNYNAIPQKKYQTFLLDDCRKLFKRRKFDDYKKTMGQLLIIAGSRSYPGAALSALEGALAVNCGMIYFAIKKRPYGIIPNEAIILDCDNGDNSETFTLADLPKLMETARKVDTILIGPGLQTNSDLKEILANLLSLEKNFVIDADAINLIAQYPEILQNNKAKNIVLTPHAGEMTRLAETFNIAENCNQIDFAKNAALKLNTYIVLKGAKTITASPNDSEVANISGVGSYALGKGGSGDILAGVIAALSTKHKNFFNAVNCGVYLHGASVNYIESMSTFRVSEIPKNIKKTIGEISPF
ncbi:MAG: NAD(P)H-hydrate dehydratase [Lentisphaeria bacterium]|nr:NAD(P)H-hydrate dehydratase [Lentisphaeria bacterium]